MPDNDKMKPDNDKMKHDTESPPSHAEQEMARKNGVVRGEITMTDNLEIGSRQTPAPTARR